MDGMSTSELWALNTYRLKQGQSTHSTGRELMRRTDRSRARCERANAEQAARRESMARGKPA